MIEIFIKIIVLNRDEKKVLLQKKSSGYYLLPSVEIKFGQPLERAIDDYLNKNNLKYQTFHFEGLVENIHENKGKSFHQYFFVFKIEDHGSKVGLSTEKFDWLDVEKIPELNFEPEILGEDLYRWLKGEPVFLSTNKKIYYG